MKLLLRYRINGNGIEVFNAGKWIPADLTIQTNIVQIMCQLGQ
jgi:hypothetical protein